MASGLETGNMMIAPRRSATATCRRKALAPTLGLALRRTPVALIVETFKARRCYASTDNIGLVVQCGGHLMGEEFALVRLPRLEVRILGTAPVSWSAITTCPHSAGRRQPGVELAEVDQPEEIGDFPLHLLDGKSTNR